MIQQINLYNPLLEPRREWLTLTTSVGCWLLTALIVAGWTAWVAKDLAAVAAQENAEEARFAALRTQVTAKNEQASTKKRDTTIEEELTRLQADARTREEIFTRLNSGAIGNTTGFSGHLQAFARQSIDGMWLTGFHIAGAGQDITLEGRTLRPELVPSYLRLLNREPTLKGHAFSELVMERPAAVAMVGKDKDAWMELPAFVEFRVLSLPVAAAKKGQ
jgi:cell division protein FtsB